MNLLGQHFSLGHIVLGTVYSTSLPSLIHYTTLLVQYLAYPEEQSQSQHDFEGHFILTDWENKEESGLGLDGVENMAGWLWLEVCGLAHLEEDEPKGGSYGEEDKDGR